MKKPRWVSFGFFSIQLISILYFRVHATIHLSLRRGNGLKKTIFPVSEPFFFNFPNVYFLLVLHTWTYVVFMFSKRTKYLVIGRRDFF